MRKTGGKRTDETENTNDNMVDLNTTTTFITFNTVYTGGWHTFSVRTT